MAPVAKSKGRDARSRNTTPLSTASTDQTSNGAGPSATTWSYADILDRHGRGNTTPSSDQLKKIKEALQNSSDVARTRSDAHDKGMRETSKRRKVQVERQQEQEIEREREEEERKEKAKRGRPRKERDEDRPLAVGAHGVARQDGVATQDEDNARLAQLKEDMKQGSTPALTTRERRASARLDLQGQEASSTSTPAPRRPRRSTLRRSRPATTGHKSDALGHPADSQGEEAEDQSDARSLPEETSAAAAGDPATDSEDSTDPPHQPRPAAAIPQRQTFGPDPSTFDDPTIYHIRDVDETMTEEEKRDILQVANYPHDDLYRLTAGTAPDKDLTNAKPANQVTSQAFANYLEPYFRPFTEEDIAFLRERGDRSGPMVIPRRGPRGYKEVWAAEDRATYEDSTANDPLSSTNQAMGSIEQMSDAAAETNSISTGPMLARLLQTLRPERRTATGENASAVNGDVTHTPTMNGDFGRDTGTDDQSRSLPPATYLPEASQAGNKGASSKIGWSDMDERVKAELRHIGFLSEDAEPDYDGHHDDPIAARLRYLQDELTRVSILNGARKARVLELVETGAAEQEYSHIADDLDTQLNQSYLKRHRNVSKGKHKLKRPGGAGGGNSSSQAAGAGTTRPSIGEPIKALMERRRKWNETIGPVVDHGRKEVPQQSIFDPVNMKRLEAKEREMWAEAQEPS